MAEFPCSGALLRCFAAAIVLLAGSLALAQDPPPGAPGDVFTVSRIPVDVSAADAVAARQQALTQGQQAGLARLLRRLVPTEDHARLPGAAALPIERFVQNFSISDEEVSGTRYIAELTVRYDPLAVRELLQTQGLPFAQSASAPILVLPLYESPAGAQLWPENNPWWQVWAQTLDPNGLVRLVLPLGDLEDAARVSIPQVRTGEAEALLALAGRYDSENVLIATATVLPESTEEQPAARFDARLIGATARLGEPLTRRAEPGQTLDDLLATAATRIQATLEEQWKAANLLRVDQGGRMVVDVPIAELSDWVALRRELLGLPEVSGVDVAQFARRNVRAQIRYVGDEFQFEEALYRLGLVLSREGETWRLLPIGANQEMLAPPNATSAIPSPALQ